jgi:predicted O-methyltransferase YrrM
MDRFRRWQELTKSTNGFFMNEAAAVWDVLLEFQESRMSGALGEIGVYHGKSASLLAQHTREREHLYLADIQEYPEATRLLERIVPRERVTFLVGRSSRLPSLAARIRHLHDFRWIHVDGEHTGEALVNDLRLASFALHDQGIICLDDFFNPMYPQVTAATFQYLAAHPHELTLVLCGHVKAYLCRPVAAATYQGHIRTALVAELARRGVREVTVFKTTTSADSPCYGIGARWKDYDYYGRDDDPDVLPI